MKLHQWWYGVVGNDQYNNAWLDEGLTDYSTALFYEFNPQYEVKINDIIFTRRKSIHFLCGNLFNSLQRWTRQ